MSHRYRRRSTHAFTLVELVVVMAIAGLIMALLLPALQLSQENARSAVCKSDARQTAIFALAKVHDDRGRFPFNYEAFRAAEGDTLICPSDPSPALVPESVHFELVKAGQPAFAPGGGGGKGGGGGGNTKELVMDTSHAIYSSYAFNPEFAIHRLLYDEVPNPSDKMYVYEGYADAAFGSSGSSLTQLVSIGGEVWYDGHKVTLTHVPPGNPFNAHLVSLGMPALDAHIGHDGTEHRDLFGDWLTLGEFNAFYKISNDFARRHYVGRPHGNIIFLDGHAEEHKAITSDMMLYPFGDPTKTGKRK